VRGDLPPEDGGHVAAQVTAGGDAILAAVAVQLEPLADAVDLEEGVLEGVESSVNAHCSDPTS
jgi:hypothetical protein